MYHPDVDPKNSWLMTDFLPTSLMIFSINDFVSSTVFSKSKLSDDDVISRVNVCFYSTIIADNYFYYTIWIKKSRCIINITDVRQQTKGKYNEFKILKIILKIINFYRYLLCSFKAQLTKSNIQLPICN